MEKFVLFLATIFTLFSVCGQSFAGTIPVYVNEFKVNGASGQADFKGTLQTLLVSRLNNDSLTTVENQSGGDLVIECSYTKAGKIFSLDALAKDRAGKTVARAFEQGGGEDDLIPAMTKLAQRLSAEIAKRFSADAASLKPASASVPATVLPAEPKTATPVQSSDIVRPEPAAKHTANLNTARLPEALVGVACGRTLDKGGREVYVLGEHSLSLYHQASELKLIANVSFADNEKLIGIDTGDIDGDGNPEVYVTMLRGESLASEIWTGKEGRLQKVAENLPYYFRSLALNGKTRKIYVQQMGTDDDFYGDVRELVKNGNDYGMGNVVKLPRFANIYNFNRFRDAAGKQYTVVVHDDGYLLVYADSGEELWRSSDKFGGSEVYLKRQDLSNYRTTGSEYRWTFLEQRVFVTPENDIIVPKNQGFFVFGNNRSYKKNSVFAFAWTGATLDEKWHTKESQNYLADYDYDAVAKELILLEVVKKKGLMEKGASTVVVKKVE